MNYSKDTKRLRKRHNAERRFKFYGLFAICLSCAFLALLLISIVSKGYTAFWRTEILVPVSFAEGELEKQQASPDSYDYTQLLRDSLKARFPEVTIRREIFQLYGLLSKSADIELRAALLKHPGAREVWLPASSDVDMLRKGRIVDSVPENQRKIKDSQLRWLKAFNDAGGIRSSFNMPFFTQGDSREPEQAGIAGSFAGSLITIFICMLLSFPLAVLSAVYLEEFAPKNRLTDFIEVNINNLAAVPSIVFGLLGLAIYLGTMGLPRSSSLVGGLTLALMVLPTIVITTRQAIKAVPPSIKEGALALGTSPLQVTIGFTVPLAMPGIMTGTILAIARALGETAPLIMIGMVAFVADIPHNFTDPATVMPVQIFLWSDNPELGFIEKTSAAIMVLLVLLMAINTLAVYLRKKFEHRW
jgi:phosphate transport system permease protein